MVIERKLIRKIFGPIKDFRTQQLIILKKLDILCYKTNSVTIMKGKHDQPELDTYEGWEMSVFCGAVES